MPKDNLVWHMVAIRAGLEGSGLSAEEATELMVTAVKQSTSMSGVVEELKKKINAQDEKPKRRKIIVD